MEITTTTTDQTPRRQAAVNALAIVGFIVLIIIGIVLAIYGARYVPVAFDKLGSASAISSVFKSGSDNQDPQLQVITSTTTVPFEPVATSTEVVGANVASSTSVTSTDNGSGTKPTSSTSKKTTTTVTRTRTVQVPVPPPAPHGNPDLSVRITAVGYCTTDDPDSFRKSDTLTGTRNGGVQFAVKNLGTNVANPWDFSYSVPNATSEQTARDQHALNPNDEIDYTLCFEKPKAGDNREIRITVDPRDRITESNEDNNVATALVDIVKR